MNNLQKCVESRANKIFGIISIGVVIQTAIVFSIFIPNWNNTMFLVENGWVVFWFLMSFFLGIPISICGVTQLILQIQLQGSVEHGDNSL